MIVYNFRCDKDTVVELIEERSSVNSKRKNDLNESMEKTIIRSVAPLETKLCFLEYLYIFVLFSHCRVDV